MEQFKVRLISEKNELDNRIGSLKLFIESEKFKSINETQQALLQIQAHAMLTYSQVLYERMKLMDLINVESDYR